jgi:hypothetical protein
MIIRVSHHFKSNDIIRKRKLNARKCCIITDHLGLAKVLKRLTKEINESVESKVQEKKEITIYYEEGIRTITARDIYEILEFMEREYDVI